MRILPIIARLKSNCALLENRAEPAKSLTALSDDEVKNDLPIAFVYGHKEGASGSELVGATSQRVAKQFTVIIAAASSTATTEPIEDIRDQIKAALIGWAPSATHGEIEYVGGEVINVTTRMEWWKDTYTTYNYSRG
jgi:hypothetical protein